MTVRQRGQLLVAGVYRTHCGALLRLAEMPDAHLVNALLRALADREPAAITEPLTAEVARRRLEDYALAVAAERCGITG